MLKLKFWPTPKLGLRRIFVLLLGLVFFSLYLQEYFNVVEPVTALEIDDVPFSDCGVVLTGSPGRVREGFEILAQKKIKKLIVSGVYKDAQLLEIFPHLPLYSEVKSSDIILEKRSETTFGNAVQSLAVIQYLKCRDILLITSQIHMHRAHRVFRTLYPSTIEIKKHYFSHPVRDRQFIDIHLETLKSVFYTVFGRAV